MKFLVIGGTRFVGFHFIRTLLAQGHDVVMFNRGKTNPNVFDGKVEKIIGDRDGEISKIGDRQFDAVIDTCGFVPRIVKQSVDFLKGKASWYIFISALDVYLVDRPNRNRSGIVFYDETGPLRELSDKTTEDTRKYYGPLKVLCEQIVKNGFGDNTIIIRPGSIVGPHDLHGLLTYWSVRIRKGGRILVPKEPSFKTQFIDARDLAEFAIKLFEDRNPGIYNVTGPKKPFDFREFVQEIKELTNSNAEFVWASDQFLQDNQIKEFSELPMWFTPENKWAVYVNLSKSLQNGLNFRSLKRTVTDTLTWYDTRGNVIDSRLGMSEDKEKILIKKLENN